MTTYFDVFNIKTDMQLNNIMNNLDLSANEMFQLDDIVNDFSSLKEKREKILEMFSGTNNYNYCCKLFLKEDMEAPSQLNMNQTIELNELFALASEKFKKVNCSQQFYQMLSQKTSKNFANAFFNMLKSIPEDSNCRFDPNLTIDGKNFAETIYPFVNELKTFLNGCKSESKKEEVKENYDAHKLWKIDKQIAQLENDIKKFEQEKNSYLDEYSKLGYKLDKARLRKLKAKREEYLNESIENKLSGVYNIKNGSFKSFKDENDKLSIDDYKNRLVNYEILPDKKLCVITAWSYADAFNTRIAISKKYPEENKNIEKWKLIFFQNGDGSWDEPLKKYIEILDRDSNTIKESIETQPDMFGGRDTYYKDGIEALDFDNVLDAMNKVAPEMDFVDDRDVKGKYSMIFQPKSSGLELNQKGLKKIKDYLSQRFGKENIAVRLAHSQYAPEIKKLYVTFINQIDIQDELNESFKDDFHGNYTHINRNEDYDPEFDKILDIIHKKYPFLIFNNIVRNIMKYEITFSSQKPISNNIINNLKNDLKNIFNNNYYYVGKEKNNEYNKIKIIYKINSTEIIDYKETIKEIKEKLFSGNMYISSAILDLYSYNDDIHKSEEMIKNWYYNSNDYTKGLIDGYNSFGNGEDNWYNGEKTSEYLQGYNEGKKHFIKKREKNEKRIKHKYDNLNESLEDTLNNFKYFITSSSDKNELNMMKDKLEILFNGSNDTELRNTISELLSMINSKLNTIKPSIDECCELGNLLEPFKTTVVNITVNDEGCLEDVEKESATNNLKALASHINDKKDCCEENNIENMQTIMSLISSLASFFQKRLCESQSYEKDNDVREELNDIKQRYLDGDLDVYDATNEVDNIIGNKSNAEAIVDSWDDSSKHGLYGINNEALLNKISNDPNVYIQGRDEIDDGQEPDVEKILDSIKYIANAYNKTFSEAKEIYSEISNTDVYSMEELDEDTVYDHSWYEVKGQKYPKRTKDGVEIKEGIKDWFKKDNRKYRIEMGSNGGCLSKDKKHIVGDKNDALIISGYKKALKLAKWLNDYEGTTIYHPVEVNPNEEFYNQLMKQPGMRNSEAEWIMKKNKSEKKLDEMCSGGATCAASVATVPSPVKTKSPKRKHKKSKVDEMALNMFKRHIIEDVNSQIDANGNHYEYRDGYFYINGDIARTKSKYKMLESLDENIELETLPGFNSEEMKLLEDIEASGNVGNEDDNNQNNNSNNNNNANNNNNQQNTNQNINQDNLGDVEQNVTQDNDLTPQQRQLKKDTEQVLDQSMNSGSDTEVSVNQGMDNNNDQASNTQTSSNNVKYKVIGKDDSDSNNIKYIIQDPNSKETMVVDATKLRLEK